MLLKKEATCCGRHDMAANFCSSASKDAETSSRDEHLELGSSLEEVTCERCNVQSIEKIF